MRRSGIARFATLLFLLNLSFGSFAQQSRTVQTAPAPGSSKTDNAQVHESVLEWHFQSKYVQPQVEGQPTPGGKLLDRVTLRSNALKTRIQKTTSAQDRVEVTAGYKSLLGVAPQTFPGIQIRGTLPAGNVPTSVVSGDFNEDGHMDFVIANGMTDDLWIYSGKGDGTFSLPRIIPLTKGISPVYLQAADLRKNGVLDLIVAESDTSTVGVLLGNGDGTFGYEQAYSLPRPPAALVADDFNRDGKIDVACVMDSSRTDANHPYLATLAGDGTGALGTPVITYEDFFGTPWNIASGDVNQDGLPDLVVSGPDLGSGISINAGDGTFTVPTPGGVGADARFADLNQDGCLDLADVDTGTYVFVGFGDCSGHFPNTTLVRMPDGNAAVRLADMNGDGNLDIITSAIPTRERYLGDVAGNTTSIAFGDGKGNFSVGRSYVGNGQSYSLAIADFNEDGKPDVVTANTATDTATAFLNDGSGGFGFPQGSFVGLPELQIGIGPLPALSFADLNRDMKLDVVLLEHSGYGRYLTATMLNDGTGKFTDPIVSDLGIEGAVGDYRLADFRGTGSLDFVGVGNNHSWGGIEYIAFAPGKGDGSFGPAVITPVSGAQGVITIGDFNADGKFDLVAVGGSNTRGLILTPFLGNGDGTFRAAASQTFGEASNASRVFTGDFNRDGKSDVLVYETSTVWQFLGNGDGTFQTARQLLSPVQSLTVADANNDNWLDLFIYPDFTTRLGQPDGSFKLSYSSSPYSGTLFAVSPSLQYGDPTTTSLITDLNGDGRVDQVAFQSDEFTYAQVLMGNGDGTFTPTYDVFPFDVFSPFKNVSYPKYSHDLDGDGRSDLLELDPSTGLMQVYKAAPAPALQIALEENRLSTNSSCGWIFPNVATSSDRPVSLSSSIAGVNLGGSTTIPAGALSQKFCFTLDSSFNWRQVFDIRAQLGSDVAVAYASKTYNVGFAQQLSPQEQQVLRPGQDSQPVTITLTSQEGYNSTVHLRCEGLSAGESCSFASETLNVSPQSPVSTTVVVHTNPAATEKTTNTVIVVADDGTVVKRQSFVIVVQPLTVYGQSVWMRTTSPGSGSTAFDVYGIPPYTITCSGLPPGATCTVTGDQVPYPAASVLSLTVTTPANIAAGHHPFTVNISSGNETKLLNGDLEISDFVLHASRSFLGFAGGTAYANFTLETLNFFNGNVSLTCSASFGGTCLQPSPTSMTLSLLVPAGTAIGRYDLNVTATSGSLTHNYVFPFDIVDVSGSFSSPSMTLKNGDHGTVDATVSVTAGFVGALSLSCDAPTVLTCTVNPATVQPTPGTPAVATVTITPGYWASAKPPQNRQTMFLGLFATVLPLGLGLVGLRAKNRRAFILLAAILLLALVPVLSSCSGPPAPDFRPPGPIGGGGGAPTTYTVTLKTDTGSVTKALANITVTVTHQ